MQLLQEDTEQQYEEGLAQFAEYSHVIRRREKVLDQTLT